MCAAALVQARMGHVIYGAEDDKRGGLGGTIDLSKHKSAHHKMNHNIEIQNKETDILDYIKWMKSILRRSDEVGILELPITAFIIDEKGRCIGRGSNKREINNDPLGHAELIALRQAAWIKNDWRFNECLSLIHI